MLAMEFRLPDATPSADFQPDPLDPLVEEFVRRLEDDASSVDLESFCQSAPREIQSALRERCADVLVLRRVLPAPLAAQAPHPPGAGQMLGEFRLLSEIGRGAMGVVYLARQISLQRTVALKVLFPHLSTVERSVERFRRESKSAAKLQHPAICPVHAVGEERGLHYFAMEFVDGRNLAAEIEGVRRRRAEQRGPAPQDRLAIEPERSYESQVADLVAQVADALDYAHKSGVIHRDIKPQNILIGRDGRPYLVDFGLAKDVDDQTMSRTGEIAGTPFYMSPEQADGRRAELDARTDVFSLGVVLYEMLTLRRPFEGKTSQQILLQITSVDPAPVRKLNPDTPRDLETICHHALEKDPARRYASAGAFALDLRRFLAHQSIVARPPSLPEVVRRKLSQHRSLVATAAAAVILTLVATGFSRELEARGRSRAAADWLAGVDLGRALADADSFAILDAKRRIRAANERRAALDPDVRQRLDRTESAIEEWGNSRLLAAQTRVNDVRKVQAHELEGAPWREFSPTPDDMRIDLDQAVDDLRTAALLYPDDPQLALAARQASVWPHVSIQTPTPGARVTLRRLTIDGLGEPVDLGLTPIESTEVKRGAYVVTVVASDGGFAEVLRLFDRRYHDYSIDVRPRRVDEVRDGMVYVSAGDVRYRELNDPEGRLRDGRIERGYWIDRTEVSNADYKRFVDATGHPPPSFWTDVDFASIADKPVIGVRWSDALLYAEWVGKRLPTLIEWQVAARGRSGWLYPWGDDPSKLSTLAILPDGDDSKVEDYVRLAEPVDSHPEGASPFGLLHTLDNVQEWCWEFSRSYMPRASMQYDSALRIGGSFATQTSAAQLDVIYSLQTDKKMLTLGFRCAKSEAP